MSVALARPLPCRHRQRFLALRDGLSRPFLGSRGTIRFSRCGRTKGLHRLGAFRTSSGFPEPSHLRPCVKRWPRHSERDNSPLLLHTHPGRYSRLRWWPLFGLECTRAVGPGSGSCSGSCSRPHPGPGRIGCQVGLLGAFPHWQGHCTTGIPINRTPSPWSMVRFLHGFTHFRRVFAAKSSEYG